MAYKNRGETYIKLGNIEKAISDYKKYLELAPEDDPDRAKIESQIPELEALLKDTTSD